MLVPPGDIGHCANHHEDDVQFTFSVCIFTLEGLYSSQQQIYLGRGKKSESDVSLRICSGPDWSITCHRDKESCSPWVFFFFFFSFFGQKRRMHESEDEWIDKSMIERIIKNSRNTSKQNLAYSVYVWKYITNFHLIILSDESFRCGIQSQAVLL